MVLSVHDNQSSHGGETTSTNIEIEALDEQHELENLEYLRQTAGLPPLFNSQTRLNNNQENNNNTSSNLSNVLAQEGNNNPVFQQAGILQNGNNGIPLNISGLINTRFDNQSKYESMNTWFEIYPPAR